MGFAGAGSSWCWQVRSRRLESGVRAAPTVTVDAVQAPAWVEQGEQRLPLLAGQLLHNRDQVVTSRRRGCCCGCRKAARSSLAKMPACAWTRSASARAACLRRPSMLRAARSVSPPASSTVFQNRRAVNVRIATVTAGIRGTDLWGSADAERDLVCLIEGRITVTHPEAEPVQMSEPLSFYVAPKGQAPKPVAAVDPDQLAKWALETELQSQAPTFRQHGRWKVSLGTLGSEDEAWRFTTRCAQPLPDPHPTAGGARRRLSLRTAGAATGHACRRRGPGSSLAAGTRAGVAALRWFAGAPAGGGASPGDVTSAADAQQSGARVAS